MGNKDNVQKWVAASLEMAAVKKRYDDAKREYSDQEAVVESYRKELGGVGANIREKFIRVVVDGEPVMVHLQWIPGTEDRRKEDRIVARIVEVE